MLIFDYKLFRKLRQILTDKVVSYFVSEMKKDRIKYKEFYNGYSLYFKEGVCTENDQNIKVGLNSFKLRPVLFISILPLFLILFILKVMPGYHVLGKNR